MAGRLDDGRLSTGVSGLAFTVLAYAVYAAATAALLVNLLPSGSFPAEGSGQPAVLTIIVEGPDDAIGVPCATTTDRASFDRLRVTPEQVMDAFHRWCSPNQPVTGM